MGNIILSDLLLLFASPQEQISVTRVAARGSVFSEHMEDLKYTAVKNRTCQSLKSCIYIFSNSFISCCVIFFMSLFVFLFYILKFVLVLELYLKVS